MQDGEELRQGPISDVPAVLAILMIAGGNGKAGKVYVIQD